MLSPTTTADNDDTKPVVLGKASSALKDEELTMPKHMFIMDLIPLIQLLLSHHHYRVDPLLSLVLTYQVDYLGITLIISDVKMESASIIRTCMEQEWPSVVKTGQKVKVKVKGKFVGVVMEKSLFQAKLASSGALLLCHCKSN